MRPGSGLGARALGAGTAGALGATLAACAAGAGARCSLLLAATGTAGAGTVGAVAGGLRGGVHGHFLRFGSSTGCPRCPHCRCDPQTFPGHCDRPSKVHRERSLRSTERSARSLAGVALKRVRADVSAHPAGPHEKSRPVARPALGGCSCPFLKCERSENGANLGARRRPGWPPGLGVQRRVAPFSPRSLRVAAKKAMRGVARTCRGLPRLRPRAYRMTFLIRNAS